MPSKVKVTRQDIALAALELVRKNGADAINARAVAKALGVSTQPIFSNYANTEELKRDVRVYAEQLYDDCLNGEVMSGKYPEYKAIGMGYIKFAHDEKELFKLLFMCDRSRMPPVDDTKRLDPIVDIVQKDLTADRERAKIFHIEMWIFVHGIATMYATGYLDLDTETVSNMLTDIYIGLKNKYEGECNNE